MVRRGRTLRTVNPNGSPQSQNITYYYDTSGRLTTKGEGGTLFYNSSSPYHAVKSTSDGSTFGYDANGNMTSRNNVAGKNYTLTYDQENRLTGVSQDASASYVYDGDGNRVLGTVNGETTVYIGNYYEVRLPNSSISYYYAGGQRVAQRTGTSAPLYLFSDHLGSTALATDGGMNWTMTMRYNPWGSVRYMSGSVPADNAFTYTGQRQDSYINLLWYGSRWYDPQLGHFLSPDSIVPDKGNPQGLDRYAFVANNPIKYVDPGGHCWGIFSFVRGIPTYNTTCENLDMALTIIKSDNASLGDKALAGGYIAVEGTAHLAVAAGGALLGCSAIAPCASVAETTLSIGSVACADGDCGNEANAIGQVAQGTVRAAQNVWNLNPFARGNVIERMLGGNLVRNNPTIDFWDDVTGTARSIKSIDLNAATYQNINNLTNKVQGYINSLVNWPGTQNWNNVRILSGQVQVKEVLLAIPPNPTAAQLAALQQLQQSALNNHVVLSLVTIP